MNTTRNALAMLALCLPLLLTNAQTRAEVAAGDLSNQWDLSPIYADVAAWKKAMAEFKTDVSEIQACRDHLTESALRLRGCLDTYYELEKTLQRLQSYASMTYDQNTKIAESLEIDQQGGVLATEFEQNTSFIRPEILAAGAQRIADLREQEPGLAMYAHVLDDILRRAPHTGTAGEEAIIAAAGLVTDAPYNFYGIFANADMQWPTIKLSDGQEVRLDQSGYSKHRAAGNRDDRVKVFKTFWAKWSEYQRTFGVSLYSQMKRDQFYAKVRNYPNSLSASLDRNKIPEQVYRTLVKQTNENLPTLHRYFRLRARMLGIKDLGYHDIYPPLVKSDKTFPIAEGKRAVLEALAPVGDELVSVVDKGFRARWMDVYPRPGKRSGAYMNGSVYDLHPFVLMNYNDDYESVSTLAHEWGHALHSFLSSTAQPYATADYAIFLAEIASTFNEALLLDHMLGKTQSDDERLFYLGSSLENLRQTFFRQAMFAEFELRIHEEVEKGEALSGQRLTEIYGDILKRYHGDAEGVMKIDDAYTIEWAYIPHFYYNFYVYQYATSIAASSLLADDVLAKQPGAIDRYLGLLKAGGSDYPYELLKKAGVDLASDRPYKSLFKRMNQIMDEIEAILKKNK